ncbi:MAG TPA: hypothetical protein VFW24_14000 [Acidimicrobiales bacterium]|nr:hypothetical protein [Acidimicrobiales bacterium]
MVPCPGGKYPAVKPVVWALTALNVQVQVTGWPTIGGWPAEVLVVLGVVLCSPS